MNSLLPQASYPVYFLQLSILSLAFVFPLGHFLLRFSAVELESRIENLALSLLTGTTFMNFLYFVMRWHHLEMFYVYILAVLAGLWFAWMARKVILDKSRSRLSLRFETMLFILLFGILLTYHFSRSWGAVQWTPGGGLILSKGMYADPVWKLAVASELEHTVPPQMPLFAGTRLVYHYFIDLFVVLVHSLTHIDLPNLRFFFIPLYSFTILSLSAFAALGRIFESRKTALLGYTLMMLAPGAMGFTEEAHIPFAIAAFFALIVLITKALETGKSRTWLLIVFLLSQLMMYESILSALFIGSIGLGSFFYLLWKKRWEPFAAIAAGGMLALGMQLIAIGRLGGGQGGVHFNFPFFEQAIIDWPTAKETLKSVKSVFKHFSSEAVNTTFLLKTLSLPFLILGAFAAAFLNYYRFGLLAITDLIGRIKNWRHEKPAMFFFLPFLALGLTGPLVISIGFFYGAVFRMLIIAVVVLYAFSALTVSRMWRASGRAKMLLITAMTLLVIYPNVSQSLRYARQSSYYALRTPEEMQIFNFLRTQTAPDAVLMHPFIDDPVFDSQHPGKPAWIFEDHYYYGSALGGRRVVMEGSKFGPVTQMLKVTPATVDQIRSDIRTIYSTREESEAVRLLKKYNVSYLWVPSDRPLQFQSSKIVSAVKNSGHTLYHVSS